MTETTFDALACFERLKIAGVPAQQASIQANAFREFSRLQNEKNAEKLATRGAIQDIRLEMQKMKYDLLKWQFGVAPALAAIMTKDFGWLGF